MSKLHGRHVSKTLKREWTLNQLRETSIKEWLYRLQLVQYRLDTRKETAQYGTHEVTFHQLFYHGLMIAEIAEVGKNEFILTKLNRVRAEFNGKDMTTGERFCTSISTMQVLDIRYWFGMEVVLDIRKQSNKKDNIGWILLRTGEAVNRFIRTVHLSMMLAPFHDFDVHGHAISGRLYLKHWKIMRDAISRPLWSNHLISRLTTMAGQDKPVTWNDVEYIRLLHAENPSQDVDVAPNSIWKTRQQDSVTREDIIRVFIEDAMELNRYLARTEQDIRDMALCRTSVERPLVITSAVIKFKGDPVPVEVQIPQDPDSL